MALRRWAISAAGAAGLAALARRRRTRAAAPAAAAEPAAPAVPAPNPLVEGGDPAQAIDAARERLRREADARGEAAPGSG
ncbi:MAG: hypothetical protein QOD86_1387 [Miltoncostaeaceae bacterium]|jgi:hypothetical protein|nr:hypothetical protein [Miltoncostaeaceae bacterium]